MFEPSYIKEFFKKSKEWLKIYKEISLAPSNSKFQKKLQSNYAEGCTKIKEMQAIANSPVAIKNKTELLNECDIWNKELQEIYAAALQNNVAEATRLRDSTIIVFSMWESSKKYLR